MPRLRTIGMSRDSSKNPSGRSNRVTIGGDSGKKKSSNSSNSLTTGSTLVGVAGTEHDAERGVIMFKQLHDIHDYELCWVDHNHAPHMPPGWCGHGL